MALELNTAGVTMSYQMETTSGTRPTAGTWTAISGIKSIPDLNPEPSSYDVTDLSDTEYKRYIGGLKDVGGGLAFTANMTSAFMTAWETLVSAATTGSATGLCPWFEIKIPNLSKSFYFRGIPQPLGLSAIAVDSVLEVDAYIVPNKVAGWAAASA